MNPLREGLVRQRVPEPCTLVIFGASGDLAHRKLLPAVYSLAHEGLLPPYFSIIGVASTTHTDDSFREDMKHAINQFSRYRPINEIVWSALARGMHYVQGNFNDPQTYKKLQLIFEQCDLERRTGGNKLFYLSTAPSQFESITSQLKHSRLSEGQGWQRVVVEKPFGHDLASARELNSHLRSIFAENEIFRIDHYLGKETVQNILVLRFANGIFEPIWKNNYIDHVQITVAETLGVGRRGVYYEEAGAARDMMQNHMMQLLALVAMEPPVNLQPESIRDEKVKALRALHPLSEKDIGSSSVHAQYTAGYIQNERVPSYREEEKVSRDSTTETFAAVRLFIDSWRWAGVPFYLRHGKRLAKSGTEISVFFKKSPGVLFNAADSETPIENNVLTLRIQPNEGVSLRMEAKVPGQVLQIQSVKMDFQYGTEFGSDSPEAYERLLLDAMIGDPTLFIRHDEAEQSWMFFDPILQAWKASDSQNLVTYPAGTWGPPESEQLLAGDNRKWRRL